MAYKDDILAAVGDVAERYGTALVFLKGKYSLKQLERWHSILADALLNELNRELVSEIGGRVT